jgi:hypothetical protein
VCEQCKIKRVSGEPLSPEDDPTPCECPPDEEGEVCPRDAVYLVSDYSVDDHLCEEHMREKASKLEEGLGDFLRSAGFQAASDFAPIKKRAACDYVSPENMLSAVEVPPCGKPAAYAELVLEKLALCPKHAREWGYTPRGSTR